MSIVLPTTINVPARRAFQARLATITEVLDAAILATAASDTDQVPLPAVRALIQARPSPARQAIHVRAAERVRTVELARRMPIDLDAASLQEVAKLPARRATLASKIPIATKSDYWGTARRFVSLYLRSVHCVNPTSDQGGRKNLDEIALFGTIHDMGAGESAPIPRVYVGQLGVGHRTKDYGPQGRLLASLDVSNARSLPTWAAATLGLVEEDNGAWADFQREVYRSVRPLIEAALDEAIEIGADVGDLSAADVERTLQDVSMILFDRFMTTLAGLADDDFFRNLARTTSPPIYSPRDTWGGDHACEPQSLWFNDAWKGEYKLKVFWKRSITR